MPSSRCQALAALVVFVLGLLPGALPPTRAEASAPDASAAWSIDAPTPAAIPTPTVIAITAAGFEPPAITVDVGTEVAWKNETTQTQLLKSGEPYALYVPLVLRQASGGGSPPISTRPSLTAFLRTAADDFAATIEPGATFTHTFITEGEHPYYLATNPKHRGRVTVVAAFPPDPSTVAPPLDPTVPTTVISATEFLYTGPNPIQTGVAPGTIEARRVAVLRGRVLTRDDSPLSAVTISVLDHPEFGQTRSRADGMFDLVVNGGGRLTVRYEKAGYLPAQRQVQAPWQDYRRLPDVVLIGLDATVTPVDLSAPIPMQVAEGSVVSDGDGVRQARLLIPQGTGAELILPGGVTETITTLNVRATEYSVGDNGPEAMPAELPAQSGYTYAVELSADEAIAAGATDVSFTQPLYFYVENFVGFPVGGIVPTGYYDRQRGEWVPSDNGRIIQIVSITGDLADLDTDGDGVADAGGTLGITEAERRVLGARYTVGQSLWRVPVTHFTPWDHNWPYGPPDGAEMPDVPDPDENSPTTDDPDWQCGSIVECQSQTLREAVPIAGTPFSLHYGSDRVPGRESLRSLQIPLSGATVPPNLLRIELSVNVGLVSYVYRFDPLPNQTKTFTWDGTDGFGRAVQGPQPVSTWTSYVYRAQYMKPAEFARAFGMLSSGTRIGADVSRGEIYLTKIWEGYIGGWNAALDDLAGWSLDVHHVYAQGPETLYLGDGGQRRAENLNAVITTVAGTGAPGYNNDNVPATQAKLYNPAGVAVGADGSIYIADQANNRIRRVGPDGIITTVAGTGMTGSGGDGGQATKATLYHPLGVAIGADNAIYIADTTNDRVRRVGPDGVITTVAGTGVVGYGGDGGPATQAKLNTPTSVAVGPDNCIYIADTSNQRIRRIGPDGIMSTAAGNGSAGYGGDGGPATAANLYSPQGIAIGPDGAMYIAETPSQRVRRVGTDGIIKTVAGIVSSPGYSGDGGLATQAELYSPKGVTVGPDNSIYIADTYNNRIRRVGSDGIITTAAGGGVSGPIGDGGAATQARLNLPHALVIGPDRGMVIADEYWNRVRRVAAPAAGLAWGEALIPSADGREVYVFDSAGRHRRTVHALTGAPLYTFGYDASFRLATVTDGDGNTTTIERDASGRPTAIVGPFGQRTALGLDANGYLNSITNPAGETVHFTYTSSGLMTGMLDARNGAHAFTYDAPGLLISDQDPAQGVKTLSRVQSGHGYTVTVTSALGRKTAYSIERRPVGGTIRRTTAPDGTRTEATIGTDGTTVTRLPDGTLINLVEGPDPRFGIVAALPKTQTADTPGGQTWTASLQRTVTLADPLDVLSLVSLEDRITINSRIYKTLYVDAGRTFTETSPAGRQRITKIDAQGRVVWQKTAGLEPVSYGYDTHGRLETISQGTGPGARPIHLTYNAQGYVDSVSDALNRTVHFGYDSAGRVVQKVLLDSWVIQLGYDANGNVTSITPPGRPAHAFTYTPVDLLQSYNPPDVGLPQDETVNTYNLDRQLTQVALPSGQSLAFAYDSTSGRLTSLTFSRGTAGYGYQASSGLLAGVAAPGGIVMSFSYDGSLLTGEQWSGPVAGSVGRSYDNDLRVAGLGVTGANTITLGYDADSLLTQAGALSLTRSTQSGLLTGSTLGSVADTRNYNGFGEPSTYLAKYNASSLYAVQLDRDGLGRIEGKTETIGGTTDVYGYTYDLAGRLSAVVKNGSPMESYTYDANGNRLSYTGPGGAVNGTYDDQDRLLQYGSMAYTYSASGELQSKAASGQTTTYQYDELSNLVAATLPGGTSIAYLIDGANRRIGKRVNAELVQGFLYDGQWQVVAELDGAGAVLSRFVYATHANVPDYMLRGGATYRILTDHLGSPRLVVDSATGQVVQRLDYDAFGRVLADTNPGFQPFGFAGGLYDRDTGLVRFGARDYDPETGRWTAKDPLGFAGGQANLYAYVGNDPLNRQDVSGQEDCTGEEGSEEGERPEPEREVHWYNVMWEAISHVIPGYEFVSGAEQLAEGTGTALNYRRRYSDPNLFTDDPYGTGAP